MALVLANRIVHNFCSSAGLIAEAHLILKYSICYPKEPGACPGFLKTIGANFSVHLNGAI